MSANTIWLEVEGEGVIPAVEIALEKLTGAGDEIILDFSSVPRIDPSALRAMESLATTADRKAATVTLRGVNVEVYRVLKLMQLAPRFSFLS
ncbi:MAG TPA: STAS domain-containing protein [Terriglobia bacterium]|nr:STAS domain-containing protein [Terriglobia bacterium]